MSEPTLYERLGISPDADVDAIRSAYRRAARDHHPDVNPSPEAQEAFVAIKDAYDTLADPTRRAAYDRTIQTDKTEEIRERMARIKAEREANRDAELRARAEQRRREHERGHLDKDAFDRLAELERTMRAQSAAGKLQDAAGTARQVIDFKPQHAEAHAILGEWAFATGDLKAAAREYAFAAQFEGGNTEYVRRYEQLMRSTGQEKPSRVTDPSSPRPKVSNDQPMPLMLALGLCVALACYLALSKEPPVLPTVPGISLWTVGTISALAVGGFAIGMAAPISGVVRSWSLETGRGAGGFGPVPLFLLLCPFSFWLALIGVGIQGAIAKVPARSLLKLCTFLVVGLLVLCVGAMPTGMDYALSLALWGGNVMGMLALVGWSIGDRFAS